jgi:nucleobase:cation symporter-1, NCS1 family
MYGILSLSSKKLDGRVLRSSFGVHGAKLAAMFRGFVACGWFGIQTYIGGNAIYLLCSLFFPDIKNSLYLGNFIGLNSAQLISFAVFWGIQIIIVIRGIECIKHFETFVAPFLIIFGIAILIWAWNEVGSLKRILDASYNMGANYNKSFWLIFWPGLTAVVGYWATLALNIPDFTRFAKSQKEQVVGQAMGMPTTMTLFAFIGITVTSATVLIYGKAIWDPVIVASNFQSNVSIVISLIALLCATLTTNIAANLVSPANDISNLFPKFISFKMGGIIACIIGFIICPWKLVEDPQGYIYRWLLAYSSLLGAMGGIMICDYFILRGSRLSLKDLFDTNGIYKFSKGWNLKAYAAFFIAVIPNLPGFLIQVGLASHTAFPVYFIRLYDYAWFISFFLAFLIYLILMLHGKGKAKIND